MRKIILTIITIVVMSFAVNAQVEDRTIGLRTSAGNYGVGPEISYQHGLGDNNRV
jgi:hypothetical protein